MKKILFVLACLTATIIMCSCGSDGGLHIFSKPTPTPVPEIDPAGLVTVDDVAAIAGYTPVIEPSGTGRSGNVATVLYRSEPLGQNDTVLVKVTQFTDTIEYPQILAEYEDEKTKRNSVEPISSLGQDAYLAFPTVHVYDRGCLIEITAGSGSDEVQRNILNSLALRAAQRLEEIIPEYDPNAD